MNTTHDSVKEYYGQTLQSSEDLQTSACCTLDEIPERVKKVLANIHDEVMAKYYGCGLIAPYELAGRTVLDLGSGSGRDVYALSQLVGESGAVVGIDMTMEQLDVARRHEEYHRASFGYQNSNVEFLHGNIEDLRQVGIPAEKFDVVVSNCVVNLATDKLAVLNGVYDALKPGGEFYFSDVYADRRISESLREDPVLYGECLSGALYVGDFRRLARQARFADIRRVTGRPLEINNPELAQRVGNVRFVSATYRLFKIPELEDACEDFGQAVRYRGTISDCEHAFTLDDGHHFETGKIERVCGNSYRMMADTRFAQHFDFFGDWSTHFGLYPDCGVSTAAANDEEPCC